MRAVDPQTLPGRLRDLGSTCCEQTFVAANRLQATTLLGEHAHDVAAGIVIAVEAGCQIATILGERLSRPRCPPHADFCPDFRRSASALRCSPGHGPTVLGRPLSVVNRKQAVGRLGAARRSRTRSLRFGSYRTRTTDHGQKWVTEIVSRTRHAIAEVNSNILVNNVGTLEEQVAGSIATQSLVARLSTFFGIIAVFLGCIGIYGLLSYSVARRTSEFGVRLALGARAHMLLWMILRESILLLAVGLAIGVPIALSSTRILKSQLYELSPLDPTAICIAIAAVSVMTIAAAWFPARRATRIDPMQALRTE